MHFKNTDYGFEWGSAHVERLFGDETGHIVIGITTPKAKLQIHVTKTGKIKVFKDGVELK
jgi:hypothetical protein